MDEFKLKGDTIDLVQLLKAAQNLLVQACGFNGRTVTFDPLHNQQQTARITVEKGDEYLQQVKGNQGRLLSTIRNAFAGARLFAGPFGHCFRSESLSLSDRLSLSAL